MGPNCLHQEQVKVIKLPLDMAMALCPAISTARAVIDSYSKPPPAHPLLPQAEVLQTAETLTQWGQRLLSIYHMFLFLVLERTAGCFLDQGFSDLPC